MLRPLRQFWQHIFSYITTAEGIATLHKAYTIISTQHNGLKMFTIWFYGIMVILRKKSSSQQKSYHSNIHSWQLAAN